MTTARQRVLNNLKKSRSGSAAQIGLALKMSAATVRHHISVLKSDGLIEEIDNAHNRKGGRGRPVKLYGISEKWLGNNLNLLSELILSTWLKNHSHPRREEVMRKLAESLTNRMEQTDFNLSMLKRLATVAERLNKFNYQARWEAASEGPRVLFTHCPYAAIINKHPELCMMDSAVLEEMLGQTARQTAKIGKAGSPICSFNIG